jgi:predicted permease
MVHDLRIAWRSLRKSPGFVITTVLALALGIGANASIFAIVNAVLIRPLPFDQPEQLVMVWEHSPRSGERRNVVNPGNFLLWRERAKSFTGLAAFTTTDVALSGQGDSERVDALLATQGFFDILRAKAELGRTFTGDDFTQPGRFEAVVLSHEFWQRRFGGAADVLGRKLTVDGGRLTQVVQVVGVMPAGFRFPGVEADVWLPYSLPQGASRGRFLRTIGRLAPGVSIDQAQSEMSAISRELEKERPDYNDRWGSTVVAFQEQVTGRFSNALWVTLGAVGFVLLIACANLANLMLTRAMANRREAAIRLSLGATRWAVARQPMLESLILSALGGAAGLLAAWWATDALVASMPESLNLKTIAAMHFDWRVFGFALLLTLLTGLLFGLAPAWRMSRGDAQDALRDNSRAASGSLRSNRLRSALVVVEVALCLVLLAGASLLLKTMANLTQQDTGYQSAGVLTMNFSLPASRYADDAARRRFLDAALERVRALPGVRAAAGSHNLPLEGWTAGTGFWRAERAQPAVGDMPVTQVVVATDGFFASFGIPLKRGATFAPAYDQNAPLVAVVNETLARTHFPGEDALGKLLRVQWGDGDPVYRIVGIAGDTRHAGLKDEPRPMVYLSMAQLPGGYVNLIVRTPGQAMALAPSVLREIQKMDAGLAVADVRPMEELRTRAVGEPRFQAVLLSAFAGLALLLAALGIFGVLMESVRQRLREFGIRLALGAQAGDLTRMVVRQSLLLVAAGLLIGLPVSLAATRLLKSQVYGVSITDPATFLIVCVVLGLVGLSAALLPVRRALRVDPASALRYE